MQRKKKKRSTARSSHGALNKKSTRKIDPRTSKKLSRAANRRRRVKGKFASGKVYQAKAKGARPDRSGREEAAIAEAEATSKIQGNPKKAAREMARLQVRDQRNRTVLDSSPTMEDLDTPISNPGSDEVSRASRAGRDIGWQDRPVYKTDSPLSQERFIRNVMAPSHQQHLDSMMADPESPFNRGLPLRDPKSYSGQGKYTPGQRRRRKIYTDALQQGVSEEAALHLVSMDGRGSGSVGGTNKGGVKGRTAEDVGMEPDRPAGRKSKFESSVPTSSQFDVGVAVPKIDSLSELEKKFPEKTEQQLIGLRQQQREFVHNDFIENQKWAHETRQANILGKRGKPQSPEEVTIFTTNFGKPNVKVPSDSLVGQYIIRKRKKSLLKQGMYSKSQLKGDFPVPTRDMHIAEALSGRHFGVQGRVGMYKRGGWRKGAKTSKGFGQPVPVGSQIVYDSQGRPMYDQQGNIRYSEGATRPFHFKTPGEVGLGIYVG